VADLLLDGATDAVVCLVARTASLTADATDSTAGAAGLVLYYFSTDDDLVRTLSGAASWTWEAPGAHTIEAVVVDADACADLTSGIAYVGDDDGSPAGPVSVSVASSLVSAGAGTTVTVSAEDCSGDIAAGQDLRVAADLGTVSGTATGAGLVVTLDATGSASFDWDFAPEFDGTATVSVASDKGGAWGTGTTRVEHESGRPRIASATPTGRDASDAASFTVEFTEAIGPGYVTSDSVALYDALLTRVSASRSVAGDGRSVTVTPDVPLNGAGGVYSLVVTDDVRDPAGNRLDGEWTGSRGSFLVEWGDVPALAWDLTGCSADLSRLTPDGDPGAAEEADELTITPVATAMPDWWWWRVEDAGGTRYRSDRADGADATFTWDARGDDGFVVASGDYVLLVAGIDAYGNTTPDCRLSVTVQQHMEAP
jgi:hypothetical protein